MGMTLELGVLLALAVLGSSFFAVFEVETPAWRKVVKWGVMIGLTIGVYRIAGHWALAIPMLAVIAGTVFHLTWCRRNGINPLLATPRRRYYELRGWSWPE